MESLGALILLIMAAIAFKLLMHDLTKSKKAKDVADAAKEAGGDWLMKILRGGK